MRTKEYKVFEYKELSPEAKERAINNWREHNQYDFLEEYLTEFLRQKLKENKIHIIKDCKIYYSLSYSQGDGFQFNGIFKWKHYKVYIKHSGHYEHSRCVQIDINTSQYGNDAKEEVYSEFKELFNKICTESEKAGYELIAFGNKEENIIDYFKSNEYEFKENGEID